MWHEARRREKATQKLLNEHKKRAEKRREENKVNPNSLLQIHGLKAKLCLDPSVYKQAVKSLVAWQGDKSITIDRFDVRATLSSIPNETTSTAESSKQAEKKRNITVLDIDESEPVKRLLNYERYRLLMQNDLNGVPEDLRLKLVAQSDVANDAKMRKLRYNKFGTSGEASISTFPQVGSTLGGQFKESTGKRGTAIGFNYNSVPPPACLNSDTDRNLDYESSPANRASDIMDLDEFDNFELDGLSDLSHFDTTRITEIVRKYGLSYEEFSLLAERDNQDIGTGDTLKNLKRLIRKNSEQGNLLNRSSSNISDVKVYGPDLPPELLAQNQPSPSTSSSSQGSPIPQRSPSGEEIPLRYRHSDSDNESDDHRSPDGRSNLNGNHIDTKTSNIRQTSTSTQSSHASQKLSNSRVTVESHKVSAINSPLDNSLSSPTDVDLESNDTRGEESKRERRASTPLAYKRNRRSSRSLSRERRVRRHSRSHHHHHSPNNRRSARRSHRSRSKSRSPLSRSGSTSSSYSSSNASSKNSRRKRKSTRR